MRILLVAETYPPVARGGAGISAREMAIDLAKYHDVCVLTPSFGHTHGFQSDEGVHIYKYRNRFVSQGSIIQQKLMFFREMTKNLSKLTKFFEPDIIHAQDLYSTPSVAAVSHAYGISGVSHVRDHRFECFTSLLACPSHHDATILEFAKCVQKPFHSILYPYAKMVTRTVRKALVKCGRAFAVSDYVKREVLRCVQLDVKTAYISFDAERLKRIRPIGLPITAGKIACLHLGGLERYKGVFELLSGFISVRNKFPNLLLLIAGGGSGYTAVREFVTTNGLTRRVVLLGPLSHEATISLIKGVDFVIVPSILPEAGSRSTVEALACGKPVLGSSRGALPELIGEAGIIFEPRAASIGNAFEKLLDNRSTIENLSLLARRRSTIFSSDKITRKILDAYREWIRASRLE